MAAAVWRGNPAFVVQIKRDFYGGGGGLERSCCVQIRGLFKGEGGGRRMSCLVWKIDIEYRRALGQVKKGYICRGGAGGRLGREGVHGVEHRLIEYRRVLRRERGCRQGGKLARECLVWNTWELVLSMAS